MNKLPGHLLDNLWYMLTSHCVEKMVHVFVIIIRNTEPIGFVCCHTGVAIIVSRRIFICLTSSYVMFYRCLQILTANDVACELFGFTEQNLIGTLLTDVLRTASHQQAAAAETLLELTGDTVQLSALVVCTPQSCQNSWLECFNTVDYLIDYEIITVPKKYPTNTKLNRTCHLFCIFILMLLYMCSVFICLNRLLLVASVK